ncbi:MAG: 4-(cytidine 5'-diphospho)-2-C-methyl-D-erythritol kinase [Candidatus Roizmanbacteria bacterium]|nr:4-(cytidine 5'-diphospho)-2-C-methyl-D-erythritol kinase [Candidatus Roizmanbacteria bacterium]
MVNRDINRQKIIKTRAFAKLNLNLHVSPYELKTGYHLIRSINCQINLFDELLFKPIKKKIEGVAEDNLIYRSAILLKKLVRNQDLGAKIYLRKNIPIKAGLAGGSSDAAAAIKGLMKLWQINLDKSKINKLAEELGKDVHYCLQGGLCQIEGDGSQVIPLSPKLPKFWLVIITPEEKKPSTKWMYDNLDSRKIGRHLRYLKMIKEAINLKDKKNILKYLFNDFESLAINSCPKITSIKNDLIYNGASKTLLAGSGFSMVGFFESKNRAFDAFKKLKVKYKNIYYVSTK